MYATLHPLAKIIETDEFTCITDNRTGREFSINREQLELLYSLDGSATVDSITSQYDPPSRRAVSDFLASLVEADLLHLAEHPIWRSTPVSREKYEPHLQGVLFDITSQCNLLCNHCYVSEFYRESRGKDLSLSEILQLIEEFAGMNVRDISLTGGEPTTHSQLKQIIESIIRHNIRVSSFFTNGVGIRTELVDYLTSLPQKPRFYISIDGATPASHGAMRGSSHQPEFLFQSAVNTISALADRGGLVTVNTSLHPGNLTELNELYQFLRGLGVRYWRMAIPKPIGRYDANQATLNPDWNKVLDAYEALLDEHFGDIVLTDEGIETDLELELELLFNSEMLSSKLKLCKPDDICCFYHRHRCAIKSNGDVLSCAYFDHMPVGNVREASFREIWESKDMQTVKRIKIEEVKNCKECDALDVCATGCRALAHRLTGDLYARDDYACAIVPKFTQKILPALLKKHGFSIATTNDSTGYYERGWQRVGL